jgi:hypothetical protein
MRNVDFGNTETRFVNIVVHPIKYFVNVVSFYHPHIAQGGDIRQAFHYQYGDTGRQFFSWFEVLDEAIPRLRKPPLNISLVVLPGEDVQHASLEGFNAYGWEIDLYPRRKSLPHDLIKHLSPLSVRPLLRWAS